MGVPPPPGGKGVSDKSERGGIKGVGVTVILTDVVISPSCYDILTKAIFLCDWWPEDRSQLFRISREHQLPAPGVIRVQEIRHRNDALGFCCVPCLVYENVREMSAGKHGWDQPGKKCANGYFMIISVSISCLLVNPSYKNQWLQSLLNASLRLLY